MSPAAHHFGHESKISSLIESPVPPVTDPKTIQTEKGVKDFSRQYLKEGMWPGKINHSVMEYRQSVESGALRPNLKNLTERGSIEVRSKMLPLGTFDHKMHSSNGSMTERNIEHKKGQLSISRTIDLPSTTSNSLYPSCLDMNVVNKINSTLDNNYYQQRGGVTSSLTALPQP